MNLHTDMNISEKKSEQAWKYSPMYNLKPITDEQIARFDRIRQGLDFGYAAHPACFERLHYDSTRRRLYLFAEVAGLNLSNRLLYMKIQKYNDVITIADSAEPKSIDELRSYGLRVTPAKKVRVQ